MAQVQRSAATMGALSCVEAHSSTEWSYSGEGRGKYVKVPSYVFVGEGAGNFDLEDLPLESPPSAGLCPRPIAAGIPCLAALLAIAVVLVGVVSILGLGGGKSAAHGKAKVAGERSHQQLAQEQWELQPPQYICGAGADNAVARDALQLLDADHDQQVSREELQDCAQGTGPFANGKADGGGHCKFDAVARELATEAEHPLPYDELVTALARVVARDMDSWSSAKRIWCCDHAGIACPLMQGSRLHLPATPEPFDCSAGFSDWWRSWSKTKMNWCCTNYRRGCGASTVPSS